MVDQIVDIAGFELVQDGDGNGAVGDGGEEAHAPVGLVAGADGHLVSFVQAALLKSDVQFGNTAGNISVGERGALEVGNGGAVPVLYQTFLQNLVDRSEFHY